MVAGPGAEGARRATGGPGPVTTSRPSDPDPELSLQGLLTFGRAVPGEGGLGVRHGTLDYARVQHGRLDSRQHRVIRLPHLGPAARSRRRSHPSAGAPSSRRCRVGALRSPATVPRTQRRTRRTSRVPSADTSRPHPAVVPASDRQTSEAFACAPPRSGHPPPPRAPPGRGGPPGHRWIEEATVVHTDIGQLTGTRSFSSSNQLRTTVIGVASSVVSPSSFTTITKPSPLGAMS